jgi:hypothetical protein
VPRRSWLHRARGLRLASVEGGKNVEGWHTAQRASRHTLECSAAGHTQTGTHAAHPAAPTRGPGRDYHVRTCVHEPPSPRSATAVSGVQQKAVAPSPTSRPPTTRNSNTANAGHIIINLENAHPKPTTTPGASRRRTAACARFSCCAPVVSLSRRTPLSLAALSPPQRPHVEPASCNIACNTAPTRRPCTWRNERSDHVISPTSRAPARRRMSRSSPASRARRTWSADTALATTGALTHHAAHTRGPHGGVQLKARSAQTTRMAVRSADDLYGCAQLRRSVWLCSRPRRPRRWAAVGTAGRTPRRPRRVCARCARMRVRARARTRLAPRSGGDVRPRRARLACSPRTQEFTQEHGAQCSSAVREKRARHASEGGCVHSAHDKPSPAAPSVRRVHSTQREGRAL